MKGRAYLKPEKTIEVGRMPNTHRQDAVPKEEDTEGPGAYGIDLMGLRGQNSVPRPVDPMQQYLDELQVPFSGIRSSWESHLYRRQLRLDEDGALVESEEASESEPESTDTVESGPSTTFDAPIAPQTQTTGTASNKTKARTKAAARRVGRPIEPAPAEYEGTQDEWAALKPDKRRRLRKSYDKARNVDRSTPHKPDEPHSPPPVATLKAGSSTQAKLEDSTDSATNLEASAEETRPSDDRFRDLARTPSSHFNQCTTSANTTSTTRPTSPSTTLSPPPRIQRPKRKLKVTSPNVEPSKEVETTNKKPKVI